MTAAMSMSVPVTVFLAIVVTTMVIPIMLLVVLDMATSPAAFL
jgi:hypothetical protein